MRNVLIDRLRKNYKLPSNIDLPSTPFPLKRSKGSKVPGSNFKQKTTLFSSIPDVPERDKKILSLPETKVETKIIKNYTKQPEQMNKKSHLDGSAKLNEDVIFESFKKLQQKSKRKSRKKRRKLKK